MIHTLLYITQYLLCAISIALVLYSNPQLIRIPAFARVMIGFSVTPFFLALYTLFVAMVWGGASPLFFLLTPLFISSVLIWTYKDLALKCYNQVRDWCRKLIHEDARLNSLRLAVVLALVVVLFLLGSNASYYVLGNDGLIYFDEARAFAAQRTIESIPTFYGEPGEVVVGHPHTFLYQAYIAQALIAGGGGYENDVLARSASQLTILFMFTSISALGATLRRPGLIPLALLITLTVSQFEYISYQDSRDGFRIIPLLLGIAALLPVVSRKKILLRQMLMPGIFLSLAIAAHTLNIIFVFLLWASLFFLCAQGKMLWKNLSVLSLVVIVLCLPPLLHYLDNALTTGHITGYGMNYTLYKGTPLWDVFQESAFWKNGDVGFWGALLNYASKYGYLITFSAIFCSLLGVMFSSRIGLPRKFNSVSMIFIFFLLIPISGIFDLSGVNLQSAMVSNLRYPLIVFAIAGIVIATVLLQLIRYIRVDKGKELQILLVLSAGYFVGQYSYDEWRAKSEATQYVITNMIEMNAYVDNLLEPGENWVSDRYDLAYYSAKHPVHIYSLLGSQLYSADSPEQVYGLLEKWNIRLIALSNDDPNWWPVTTFYKVIYKSKTVSQHKLGYWTIFIIER